jgi:hypothetical protein
MVTGPRGLGRVAIGPKAVVGCRWNMGGGGTTRGWWRRPVGLG